MKYFISRLGQEIPRWPPDVFCMVAAVLHRSGAYTVVTDDQPPRAKLPKGQNWPDYAREIGTQWRNVATTTEQIPPELQKHWTRVVKTWKLPLSQLRTKRDCLASLLFLLACSDEACVGVGISISHVAGRPERVVKDPFLWDAEERLFFTIPEGSTMCKEIDPTRARVLPKMHTPQNGMTIRSLSHYAAYCPATDLRPEWYSFGTETQEHSLNLLIIPWPKRIVPSQFLANKKVLLSDSVQRGSYGLFTFQAAPGPSTALVRQIIKTAEMQIGRIDGVILPELALSQGEYQRLARNFVTDRRFLIAGVGQAAPSSRLCGTNSVHMDMVLPGDFRVPLQQQKHHRWKLNKSQIMQYGIGTNLHPEANWWEHISLAERKLMFISLRPWLTMSVLICEDLARPDPVGDLARAVGPNLVIALLMDGPQLSARWPARYAASLADDPGSSVLTVTSTGMSGLSRPHDGENRNNVIALWKDTRTGRTRELQLPDRASALVLNITVEYGEEWTADGRGDLGVSGYPILAGHHPIFVEQNT
ncbi:MAG TPA: hypothetical protein VG759_28045 [Candidatus Angelobacter sp.]|nr:hypothetical protein [Candidatus Angelobacter sp.]